MGGRSTTRGRQGEVGGWNARDAGRATCRGKLHRFGQSREKQHVCSFDPQVDRQGGVPSIASPTPSLRTHVEHGTLCTPDDDRAPRGSSVHQALVDLVPDDRVRLLVLWGLLLFLAGSSSGSSSPLEGRGRVGHSILLCEEHGWGHCGLQCCTGEVGCRSKVVETEGKPRHWTGRAQ